MGSGRDESQDERQPFVRGESDVMQSSHHALAALVSPPLPPPYFNPPADVPVDPTESISSPGLLPSIAAAVTPHSIPDTLQPLLVDPDLRPQLRALRRVSNEAVSGPASGTSSGTQSAATSGSEGSNHLIEAREKLLSDGEGRHSGCSSRRSSGSADEAPRFDFHLISPTPPLSLQGASEESTPGLSKRRSWANPHSGEPYQDLLAEHAWDSVWPAPGSAIHPPVSIEAGVSRFPIAPVSPFVTPAFSPAIIPVTSQPRRPPSPIKLGSETISPRRNAGSPTPLRISPKSNRSPEPSSPRSTLDHFPMGRRGSLSASSIAYMSSPSPPSVSIKKHNRSLSSSSPSSPQTQSHRETAERHFRLGHRPASDSPPLDPRLASGSPSATPHHGSTSISQPGSPSNSRVSWKEHNTSSLSRTNPHAGRPGSPPLDVSGYNRLPGKLRRSSSHQSVSKADAITDERSECPHATPIPPDIFHTNSMMPMTLPPPVTTAPVSSYGDDGAPQEIHSLLQSMPSVPVLTPATRPAVLRRALSDLDGRPRTAPSFHRTLSITADLDKSPKRSTIAADLRQPSSPAAAVDTDMSRIRKSPRRSPQILPLETQSSAYETILSPTTEETMQTIQPNLTYLSDSTYQDYSDESETTSAFIEATFVDEGDVLPIDPDVPMDVTFDDEGLNTLERIFLLTKSDYPFHRAYVARVLGDLLYEVDPCESVEYVLPLLNGFLADDDESVKEAFAQNLHRVIWYFLANCDIVNEPDVAEAGVVIEPREHSPPAETLTITSEGVTLVPKPTAVDLEEIPIVETRRTSVISLAGPSSAGSSLHPQSSTAFSTPGEEGSTPASTVSSQATAYSSDNMINPFADDSHSEKGWIHDLGPLVSRPRLAANWFTPLLGALLLNANTVITEAVRTGLVAIFARLRGNGELDPECWGSRAHQGDYDGRRTFPAQTGPHSHDIGPLHPDLREAAEQALLEGIVIGMGQLSIDLPEHLFAETIEEGQRAVESYAAAHEGRDPGPEELFREQMMIEATTGRATSMNLIGSLCDYYNGEEVSERGFVREVLRSADGDIPVRAEGAVAMGSLAKIVPVEHINEMIPLFEAFIEDEDEHVRQSACVALPSICRRIESAEYRRSFAVKSLQTLVESGPYVRVAAMEMMGEMIYIFADDPNGPPHELLDIYMDDSYEVASRGLDSDWDLVASFNLPGVCLTLGPNRWNELRNLYVHLQHRAGDKIMRTLSASLHELAKILREDQVESDLLPVYHRCLESKDEIRERLFEHADMFLANCPTDLGWRLFLDLADGWQRQALGGWRARELLALHLPSFVDTFAQKRSLEPILQVMRLALQDPFAAVRDAATKGIPKVYLTMRHGTPISEYLRDILLDLAGSPVYRQRLTFVRCLREFVKPPPNRIAFEEFFLPHLFQLSRDVDDVRLGLAQVIADLFVLGAYYGTEQTPIPSAITQLASLLAQDDATDVRNTLRNLDLSRMVKGKSTPCRVSPQDPPDRALHSEADSEPSSGTASHQDTPITGIDGRLSISSNTTVRPFDPLRRPSTEVEARMDMMQLEPSLETKIHQNLKGKQAALLGNAVETEHPDSLDPFEESFLRVTSPELSEGTPRQ